jgi:transaldolase
MASTLLDQLRTMSKVVADTGDIQSIGVFQPEDATTNPSLLAAAAAMPQYQAIVDQTLRNARAAADSLGVDAIALAIDQLSVDFGIRILDLVPGRVSTEVDARLSYDSNGTVDKARYLISLYERAGIPRQRILIKIASTWEGVEAARQLESEGIHCNLTLLFGIHQAVACAEAGVTLISPFVGRILDWYVRNTGQQYEGAEDPGVQSVTSIYNYFKKFGFETQVMGASFRNIGEIEQLAGCDLLTISPALLAKLSETERELSRKLHPAIAADAPIDEIDMNRETFDRMHAENQMASDKLAEGINGFTEALEKLEQMLSERLPRL